MTTKRPKLKLSKIDVAMHGPPDGFSDRVKHYTDDLMDEFLNRWFKANEANKKEKHSALDTEINHESKTEKK